MPKNPLDVLWDQIQIAYAAIIRAQKIMYAETKEEAIALYKRVPRLLKDKVEQILIESGCEDLIKESEEQ